MTGTLAQIIALTTYGNDYLINGKIPPDFNSTNTTFQFCNKVDFMEFKRQFFFSQLKRVVIANNPTEWFHYLKKDGCKHLRLYFEYSKDQSFAKDHKMAGFVGGGGSWLIEAVYDNYSNYWANNWTVTNQNATDKKIWSVSYGMTIKKKKTNNLQVDNQKAKDELKETLTEITNFAHGLNLKYWAETFEKALKTIDSPTPEKNYYHTDLISLNNYSLQSKQILFSAGTAWVFGGMGSWNDLGFDNKDDNEAYDRLSEQLYSNINKAIVAAINTY
jgi:hypothetical protein